MRFSPALRSLGLPSSVTESRHPTGSNWILLSQLDRFLLEPQHEPGTWTQGFAPPVIALPPPPHGTIVLLHGRGGIKENMLWVAQRFVAADFRCIVYDARAHGQSEGRHCTFGKMEVGDLAAVLFHYETLLGNRGENLGPVGAFGNSLGAAVALQSMDSPWEDAPEVKAVVAVAPFASLSPIIVSAARKKIHRYLPKPLILASMRVGGWRAQFDPISISPISSAKKSVTPLFLAHGRLDGVIPVDHSHRIRKQAQASPLIWKEVETGCHGNVLGEGGDDLYEQMIHFLLEHLRHSSRQAVRSTEWVER